MPALMCTTVPPAKSRTPAAPRKPPGPQTQWAIGAYTRIDQAPMNHSNAENFMRSANAPTISAGVMMAKVIWKVMNTDSGIVPLNASTPMPLRNIRLKPPKIGLASVKARE